MSNYTIGDGYLAFNKNPANLLVQSRGIVSMSAALIDLKNTDRIAKYSPAHMQQRTNPLLYLRYIRR